MGTRKLGPPGEPCQSSQLANSLCSSMRLLLQLHRLTHIPYMYQATCQSSYGFGRRHSCGSSCSCGPVRCLLVLERVRTMVRSIEVANYVQDVGRLTDKVARATSS